MGSFDSEPLRFAKRFSTQDDSTTLVHTLAVFRHHFHFIERRTIDINRNPPGPVRACDEDFPFPLVFTKAEKIGLIIHLKIQQLFIPPKKSATDLHGP